MEESSEVLADMLKQQCSFMYRIEEKLGQINMFGDELLSLKRTVEDIYGHLLTHTKELQQVREKQNEIDHELQALRNLPQIVESDSKLDNRLELYVNDIHETLEYHQRYIEAVDNQLRGKNLIFHGIPEDTSNELGLCDKEKVKNVIKKTGYSNMSEIDNINIMRLGENRADQDKPRPIPVKLNNHETQKQLLIKAKQLRNENGCSRIYIKKDLHYTVRRELNRLKRREMQEKDDPRNEGLNIRFDWKERVLKIDGMMVDRFKPSF